MSNSSLDPRLIQLTSILVSINSNLVQLQGMISKLIEISKDDEEKDELRNELIKSFQKTDETFEKFHKYFDLVKKS